MSDSSLNDYPITEEFDILAPSISGAGFSLIMNDSRLGAMVSDFTFDALTPNSRLNNLVNDLSDDVVSGSLNPATHAPTAFPQLLSSLDEPLSLSNAIASKTETDTQSDVFEVLDAPNDNRVLLDFAQPSVGNLGTNATESLGGLYDDPIDYGTPLDDAYYWRQQQGNNSCAVVAQICVYESLTGEYISEDDASNYAQQQGWFDPLTGTRLEYVGKILDVLGIETYQAYGASFSNLESALAGGDKPIVGLDGNEIWNPQYDGYGNPIDQANAGHAVWVTGIDYEWDGSVGIVLNDSGTPNGQASVVGYSDFMNAWYDYGNFVIVADNPFA